MDSLLGAVLLRSMLAPLPDLHGVPFAIRRATVRASDRSNAVRSASRSSVVAPEAPAPLPLRGSRCFVLGLPSAWEKTISLANGQKGLGSRIPDSAFCAQSHRDVDSCVRAEGHSADSTLDRLQIKGWIR
jgi:hypothetical protein